MVGVRCLAVAGLFVLFSVGASRAGDVVIEVYRPGTAPPCSSGRPAVAWWAKPGRTDAYRGYYVGGGSACCGQGRCVDEGTWGRDYTGWCGLHKVWLQWSHGRRHQGGEGAYETDGPHVPNILAVPPPPHRGEGH